MTEIIIQGLIFIGAAVLFVPFFHRIGFGSVLGYLIAGVMVGPHVFRLIKDSESTIHFAELGVVLLLFVIGLEIRPRKLWAMKKNLLGLGGVQVFGTMLIFTLIGLAFKLTLVTSLVLGFGMSLSSTAFAVQSLISNNKFNTEYGRSSFSILLMQDLLAIPALAIIPALGSGKGQDNSLIWLFPFLILGLILISRYLIQPFFRYIARTNQREIFTVTALFVVLGVALMMLQIGLSAALGTFIAGVLLADSDYRHELEANLEPFKSLLLGLFFMAVGMSVSLPLIFSKPLLILFLTIIYLCVKCGVIYGVGRLFKLGHMNAKQMMLTIAQGGEFAFVIFSLAYDNRIIDEGLIQILTVVVTLSMALNPLLIFIEQKIKSKDEKQLGPDYDQIKGEFPEVIIAGFGRFGQMFGRILRAQNIPYVAIDHDADQLVLLRKFGNKIYYGDVARLEILESAGVARAKYFVMAIDDVETSVAAVKLIRSHFPHIEIFARARNRGHVFDFIEAGVTHIKRETFDSSVNFVGELLEAMGQSKERAKVVTERFKIHDHEMMLEQYKVRNDDEMFLTRSKQGGVQLADVLSEESIMSYIGDSKFRDLS